MVKRLLQSLVITLTVSMLLAWPLVYLHINFISAVGFFTTLQFVVFYFYGEHVRRRLLIEEERLIISREAELSKQGTEVTCPCDRQVKAFIPIVLNSRNEYTCPGCNKDINVAIHLKTALITTPILDDTDTLIKNNLS